MSSSTTPTKHEPATASEPRPIYQDALNERLQEMLRRVATVAIDDAFDRAAHRMAVSAAVVRDLGMPARHAAARAALSSAAGVYDTRFRPDATVYPDLIPGATVAWDSPDGVIVDVCFLDPRLEPLNPNTRQRVQAVRDWAAQQQVQLAAVNVLPLARPADALSLPGRVDHPVEVPGAGR